MSLPPVTVPTGAIRYNTDSNKMECFNGTKWMQVAVSESAPIGARGIVGGGNGASNIIQYNTIATTGDAVDFGDLHVGVDWAGAVGSRTRGVWGGGRTPSNVDNLQYVTIATQGNATDGGNLTSAKREMGGCGDQTRGCYGGETLGQSDDIDYITIASTGNAQDFGDLIGATDCCGAAYSSPLRGVFINGGSPNNDMEYITFATKGNGIDFGDATWNVYRAAGLSNAHGGL